MLPIQKLITEFYPNADLKQISKEEWLIWDEWHKKTGSNEWHNIEFYHLIQCRKKRGKRTYNEDRHMYLETLFPVMMSEDWAQVLQIKFRYKSLNAALRRSKNNSFVIIGF